MVPGLSWQEVLDGARQGTIDVIAAARKTPDREKFFNFSQTYIPTPLVVFTRNDNARIRSRSDIEGEKIALVRGYASHEQIGKEFSSIETFWYAKPLYALRAVSTGRADAYIGSQGPTSYLVSRHGMTNLKVAAVYDDSPDGQRFAVRKDWPELAGILDKALDTIPAGDRFKIMSKWITLGLDLAQQKNIVLTKQEKEWLAGKKDIRLGVDPAWPPFEFFDTTKTYSGIASDYVQILNKRLNVRMAPLTGLPWPAVMDKARRGEIDILPCVVKTPERSKYLLFTRPYLSFPMVILTRDNAPYISGVMDFENNKIALVRGYASQEILERKYPDRRFVHVNNVDEALRAVSNGKIDAFVGNLASISYATQKLGLTNLKVATTTPHRYELSFAVRKDWPEMVDILNKTIETITDTDASTIHNRWINVRFERQFDWMLVLKIVIPIIFVGGLALFIFVRWNRALSREVSERRKVEEALLESRATARGLLDATQESLLLLDKSGNILAVNQTAAKRLNHEPEDLVGTNRFDFLDDDVRVRRQEMLNTVLQTGTPADFEDTRDGIIFRSRYYPVKDKSDEIVGVAIFSQDITERKKAEQAVKESEERLKTILETTHEGFWMIDNETRTIDINNSMCRLLGRSRRQVLGKKVSDFLDDENKAIMSNHMLTREQGRGSTYELTYLRPEGSRVPCILSGTPLLDSGGRKIGSFAMITDITERKKAEEELHRNIEDLERFSKMSVGREERMIELKNEINELRQRSGFEKKYKIVT
jgi:PAS domain S-box-containing protein